MKTITIPKKGYAGKQAAIVVRCGGIDMTPGAAHFLEHKLFEDPELNLFEEFTTRGASVNAYTHFTHTVYYFSAIDSFNENLQLLYRLIEKPHFTDENVEKEKGIILAEIDMYADNPFWQVYTGLHSALFKGALSHDILGTKESVQSITAGQLDAFYEKFYTPDNMALIRVGDFGECEVGGFDKNEFSFKNDLSSENEPTSATNHLIEKQMAVSIPLFQLGFKAIYKKHKDIDPITLAACSILSDMIAGESSNIYVELYDKGMIDNQFTAEYIGGSYYGIFLFAGASHEPEAVRDRILQEIKQDLDHERFEMIKNKHIGRYIRGFNSIETLCASQADLFTKGYHVNNMMAAFKNVTFDDVNRQMHDHLRLENHALSVVRPWALPTPASF